MKRLVFAALMAATCSASAATYTPTQAAAHVGETAMVQGIVTGTHVDERSGTGFINMGGRYPNHAFQGFITRSALGRFGDLQRFDGRTIGITGTIKDYRQKPEIILSSPSQITAQ